MCVILPQITLVSLSYYEYYQTLHEFKTKLLTKMMNTSGLCQNIPKEKNMFLAGIERKKNLEKNTAFQDLGFVWLNYRLGCRLFGNYPHI